MKKVAFIGAGNMNASIIKGLIKQGIDGQDIIVANPSAEKRLALADALGIKQTASNLDAASFADFIVLGVKPHLINDVCQEISQALDISTKCFLSVAAGCTISQMKKVLGENIAIIRTMPNTPTQLGLGMTGMFACPSVSNEQCDYADQLMAAAGETVWVDKETQIDDITSISGSGPAYFFLFMEAMQQQAKAAGFSEAVSRKLVQQTALGAANMVVYNAELEISELRNNVTSKGGTTQAALTTLIDGGLTPLVGRAVAAALNRAKEISQQNS